MQCNDDTTQASLATPKYIFALWNLVIRPPRFTYTIRQLGPTEFTVGGVVASRRDVCLKTARGTKLECSHYVPHQDSDQVVRKIPVVIYLHGNSSNRLEASGLVGILISQRISLFCFDAAGCGLSEGDYVSLGWYERDDLAMVIEYLRQSPLCGPLGIWGRSMGAATALLHADRDPSIDAMLLDSPFADFGQLAEELLQSQRMVLPFPGWLVGGVLELVRARVRALANFDIMDLKPIHHARRSRIPALFIHGRDDTFISPAHSEVLFEAYSGDRELITIAGTHNSPRSRAVVGYAVRFFRRAFRLDDMDRLALPRPVLASNTVHPEKQTESLLTFGRTANNAKNDLQHLQDESVGFILPASSRQATMPGTPICCGSVPAPLPPPVAPNGATDGAFSATSLVRTSESNLRLRLFCHQASAVCKRHACEFPLSWSDSDSSKRRCAQEVPTCSLNEETIACMGANATGIEQMHVDVAVEGVLHERITLPAMAQRCTSRVPPSVLWAAMGGGA